ncbi:MAG: hypothetical protein AAF974_12025, partial [Cyanobacteria bacterium P01_E01_bin.34]
GVALKIVDGFKEIGLPEGVTGSQASPPEYEMVDLQITEQQKTDRQIINRQAIVDLTERDWGLIVDQIRAAFSEVEPGATYGRYLILLACIRMAKRDGQLPYPNRVLGNALQATVDDGLLMVQPDDSYRLIDNIDDQFDTFLQTRLTLEPSEIPVSS